MRALKIFFPLILAWIVYLLQYFDIILYGAFSVGKSNGWTSIFTGVFFHGNFQHLIGNTQGLLAFLPLTYVFYRKSFLPLVLCGLFVPALFSYMGGPNVIGISGLVYALSWFLIFSGLLGKNLLRLLISVTLVIFFGKSLMMAVPPIGPTMGVAWHTHLYGLLVGLGFAINKNV